MTNTALRDELRQARAYVEEGQTERALDLLDRALQGLDTDNLLTTTQAAAYLGLGSVNTVKALVRREGVPYTAHGNRMMIPVAALERLRDSAIVRGLRAADRAHETTADLDGDLTAAERKALRAGRPGRAPWDRVRA